MAKIVQHANGDLIWELTTFSTTLRPLDKRINFLSNNFNSPKLNLRDFPHLITIFFKDFTFKRSVKGIFCKIELILSCPRVKSPDIWNGLING